MSRSPHFLLAHGPGSWADSAACRGTTVSFVVSRGGGGERVTKEVRRAKAMCRACPVRAQCLEWSCGPFDPVPFHVAGGLTPDERRRARRAAAS